MIKIKKVNSDDLIYKYKGNTADVKFDGFKKQEAKLLNFMMIIL